MTFIPREYWLCVRANWQHSFRIDHGCIGSKKCDDGRQYTSFVGLVHDVQREQYLGDFCSKHFAWSWRWAYGIAGNHLRC